MENTYPFHDARLLFDRIDGHIGRTNLLRNAAGLAILHVGSAQFVQDFGLAGVDVTEDAYDGRT